MARYELTHSKITNLLRMAAEDAGMPKNDKTLAELEDSLRRRLAFDELLGKRKLKDLNASTLEKFKGDIQARFGDDVEEIKVSADKPNRAADVALKIKGKTFKGSTPVDEPKEKKLQFVPFPVATTGDPNLVWELAHIETQSLEEANMALQRVQDEFWQTKKGLKLLAKKVPKTFAEFVDRVPSKALTSAGLKRHYKQPEVIRTVVSEHHAPTTETRYTKA